MCLAPLPLARLTVVDVGTTFLTTRFNWAGNARFDRILVRIAKADEPETIIETAEVSEVTLDWSSGL